MRITTRKINYIKTLEEFNKIQATASYFSIETGDYEDVTGQKYYDVQEVYETLKTIKKEEKNFTGEVGKYYVVLNAETDTDIYKLYGAVRMTKTAYKFIPEK